MHTDKQSDKQSIYLQIYLLVKIILGHVELPDLGEVVVARELLPGELGHKGVVELLQRKRREVSFRVPVLVDLDVVPGDGIVSAHLDDGSGETCSVSSELGDGGVLTLPTGLFDHLVKGLKVG